VNPVKFKGKNKSRGERGARGKNRGKGPGGQGKKEKGGETPTPKSGFASKSMKPGKWMKWNQGGSKKKQEKNPT